MEGFKKMKASPHRHTTAEVDLVAIKNNIKKFKKYLGPKPQIWGVVKANAYGHGAVAVPRSQRRLCDHRLYRRRVQVRRRGS